jgi:hypothetical protein
MAIRKRGDVWWVDFTSPSGERIRRSAETGDKIEAQEYHDRLKAEAWRQDKLDETPRRTWNDAVVRTTNDSLRPQPTLSRQNRLTAIILKRALSSRG